MLFDAIFLTLFFLTWTLLGGLVWLVWSVRRRAYGAIWALPFALLGGAGGGALAPVAGLDTGVGVGVSMLAALVGAAAMTAAAYWAWDTYRMDRWFARWAVRAAQRGQRATRTTSTTTTTTPDVHLAGRRDTASVDSRAVDSNTRAVDSEATVGNDPPSDHPER